MSRHVVSASRPVRWPRSASMAGTSAACSGVFPSSDSCGSSAHPSGMMMAYFMAFRFPLLAGLSFQSKFQSRTRMRTLFCKTHGSRSISSTAIAVAPSVVMCVMITSGTTDPSPLGREHAG